MRDDLGRGHCPHCGRFVSDVVAYPKYVEAGYASGPVIDCVIGFCVRHGWVNLGDAWSWDEFDFPDDL